MPFALRSSFFRNTLWFLGVLMLAPSLPAQSSHLGPAPSVVRPRSMTTPRLAAEPEAAASWIDISDRETVRQFYLSNYVPLQNFPMGWTGNLAAGNAGDTTAAYKNTIISLVNFFRSLARVPAVVTLDPVTSPKDQKAALMFAANKMLSHS